MARRQPESSCQAGPVSQDQVCQSKHHVQFSSLFLQTSVSCFPASEPALDHSENMLDFCSDGGFFPLTTLDLSLGTDVSVFCLGWTAIDFIPDLFAGVVSQYGRFPLLGAKVTAVAMDGFFLAAEQLRHHRYIMNVSGSDSQGMYQPSVLVYANMINSY